MKAHRSEFTVEGMSKALGLTRGGDYRRLKAGPSQRALANERLTQKIHEVFEAGCQTYGSLRVTAAAYHVWTPDIPCLRIWEGLYTWRDFIIGLGCIQRWGPISRSIRVAGDNMRIAFSFCQRKVARSHRLCCAGASM